MRQSRGELISAGCALALLILMFAFAWYGVDGIPGRTSGHSGVTWTENAWHALRVIRWPMLATVLVAVGSAGVRFAEPGQGSPARPGAWIMSLGLLTSVLLMWRVLIDLPSPDAVVDQKLGAILGLISALGVALGGWESLASAHARTTRRRASL